MRIEKINVSIMKKRCYRIVSLMIFFSILAMVICRAEDRPEEIIQEDKHFKVLYKGNYEYYYAIYNTDGRIVQEGEGKQPGIWYINGNIIRVGINAGTNTLCTTYYDTKNDRLSEVYISPVAVKYGRVAYVSFRQKDAFLVVKNIFDEDYYQEFYLDFSFGVSLVYDAEFLDRNTLLIYYKSGEEYEKKLRILKLDAIPLLN